MRTSEQTKEIFDALMGIQRVVGPAMKTAVNGHLKNKYADLGSVWDAIRGPLETAGVLVVQAPSTSERGVVVTTRLVHAASGQWIEAELCMPAGKGDAHGVGSAITYARRYMLATMLGVLAEDDDGEAAVGRGRSAHRNGNGAPPPRDDSAAADWALVADDVIRLAKNGKRDAAIEMFKAQLGKQSGAPESERSRAWSAIDARAS